MKRLGVIGVGSAGIQSLCHFLAWLDGDWQIVSIHDPSIEIVGIGESTNPPFLEALQNGVDFSFVEDLEKLDGTLKFGVEYINWRKNNFVNPLVGGNIAMHINTFKLSEYSLPRMRKRWGEKFKEIKGHVASVKDEGNFVSVNIDNQDNYFDYVIDCRGFTQNLSDYIVLDDMPVNHCLVHNSSSEKENSFAPTSTGHVATKNGWMFDIPLSTRRSYGYLFNDKITSIEDAKKDFSKEINVEENELDNIEYVFKSYYAKKFAEGRVFKNGNRAIFFEPLFANSLWTYSVINRLIFSHIALKQLDENTINNEFINTAKSVETMIAYHYHGGSIYDTDFWKYAKSVTKDKAHEKLSIIAPQLKFFTDNNFLPDGISWVFAPKVLLQLDKNFEYGYFT